MGAVKSKNYPKKQHRTTIQVPTSAKMFFDNQLLNKMENEERRLLPTHFWMEINKNLTKNKQKHSRNKEEDAGPSTNSGRWKKTKPILRFINRVEKLTE